MHAGRGKPIVLYGVIEVSEIAWRDGDEQFSEALEREIGAVRRDMKEYRRTLLSGEDRPPPGCSVGRREVEG